MARLNKGFFGGFSGPIGNIEGYELNGQYIIRSRKAKSNKPPSEKQLANWQKMTVVNHLLGAFTDFVKVGFAGAAKDKTYTAYNAAVGYQLRHAITGQYPDYQIDYTKLRLTQGPLPTPGIDPTVSLQGNILHFTWLPGIPGERATDHVLLMAYCPALNEAIYNLCGAKRYAGMETLEIYNNDWIGRQIETYLSFKAENGIRCMNSIYTGRLD
jgi:hypothetical protein